MFVVYPFFPPSCGKLSISDEAWEWAIIDSWVFGDTLINDNTYSSYAFLVS